MKINKLSDAVLTHLIGAIQLVLIIFLISYVLNLNKRLKTIDKKLAGVDLPVKKTPERVSVKADSLSPAVGSEKATVTMTIFSDFECGFCKVFATTIFPQLKKRYVDKGLVKVNFRHLPLEFHKNALMAAEASACAQEQGQFWDLHDYLFNNQSKLDSSLIFTWASKKRLNLAQFNGCIINHTYKSRVEKDMQEATMAGLKGTPAIIINDNLIMGARSYEHFAEMIEQELSKTCADCAL
ncbi:DsbA family protein [Mucilaginibacter lutimaris]|uniref:DsbA family protein n=1 Tax=Mucilaginibacter lutimaris TaxID=931629 RepID=A0ABW2ZK38_9SPHI